MKKSFFLLATLLVAFGACTTREAQPEQVSEPKTITFKARIADPDPDTRVSFTEATEGIKTTFEAEDVVYLFDAEGNLTEFTVTEVDENGVATFSGTPETEIAEGAAVTAVVKNPSISVNDEGIVTVKLNNQAGTLESAAAHNLLYASGTYSAQGVSLVFEHKTSLLKLTLTLPQTESATTVNSFYLFTVPDRATATDQGGKQFNYFNIVSVNSKTGEISNGRELNSSGEETNGWINWTTASPVNDHVVTLYLSVPAVDLKNAALQCTPGSSSQKRYFWNLAGSSPLTIEAGKAYKITRTQTQFAPSAAGKSFFYSDDAQIIDFGLPQGSIVTYETSTGDWLSKETDSNGNMRIRMTANTTGSPRESTLIFKVFGAFCKYSITQANASDFAGAWSVSMSGYHREATAGGDITLATEDSGSSKYGSSASTGIKANNYYDMAWVAPTGNVNAIWNMTYSDTGDETFLGQGYSNFKNAKPNNITITGIYQNLTMAARVETNYSSQWARFFLYFNTQTQTISGGPFDGQQGAIVTELMKAGNYELGTAHGGNGYLYGAEANSANYTSNIKVNGNTTTITFTELQRCPAYYSSSASWVIKGIMVTRLATTTNNGANLVRSPKSCYAFSNTAQGGAAYAAVYQGTITLTKTGANASPADINVPAVENTAW